MCENITIFLHFRRINISFYSTHHRFPTWLIGLNFGHFLHKYRTQKFSIPTVRLISIQFVFISNFCISLNSYDLLVFKHFGIARVVDFNGVADIFLFLWDNITPMGIRNRLVSGALLHYIRMHLWLWGCCQFVLVITFVAATIADQLCDVFDP